MRRRLRVVDIAHVVTAVAVDTSGYVIDAASPGLSMQRSRQGLGGLLVTVSAG
ncbi:MAG: hypothetical protein QGI32_00545 [Candidatus Latescibacteria bacterium]|jgi:hypothetical protein|nr:hypothetical protein [Candidatus Latescibacterota bacterium]